MALFEDIMVELGVSAAKGLILDLHGPGECVHCSGTGTCECSGCQHSTSAGSPADLREECAVCTGTGVLAGVPTRRSADEERHLSAA
jgi:hypothetical protein